MFTSNEYKCKNPPRVAALDSSSIVSIRCCPPPPRLPGQPPTVSTCHQMTPLSMRELLILTVKFGWNLLYAAICFLCAVFLFFIIFFCSCLWFMFRTPDVAGYYCVCTTHAVWRVIVTPKWGFRAHSRIMLTVNM